MLQHLRLSPVQSFTWRNPCINIPYPQKSTFSNKKQKSFGKQKKRELRKKKLYISWVDSVSELPVLQRKTRNTGSKQAQYLNLDRISIA